jgi:hypothetical protein
MAVTSTSIATTAAAPEAPRPVVVGGDQQRGRVPEMIVVEEQAGVDVPVGGHDRQRADRLGQPGGRSRGLRARAEAAGPGEARAARAMSWAPTCNRRYPPAMCWPMHCPGGVAAGRVLSQITPARQLESTMTGTTCTASGERLEPFGRGRRPRRAPRAAHRRRETDAPVFPLPWPVQARKRPDPSISWQLMAIGSQAAGVLAHLNRQPHPGASPSGRDPRGRGHRKDLR